MTYMGREGFVWFQGVVEDRNDPLQLGRCRIRCLGFHTDDKTEIPTDCLPWAFPIQSINSASMNGIGHTPVGPVEGTWVVGFFRDGLDCQEPVFFGTIGGIEPLEKPNTGKGFCDPSGFYPKDGFTAEADTNRLARGITQDTIVETKILGATGSSYAIANTGETWGEPMPPFGATYPFNHVYESESGHIQEFDDTEGAERIHTWHKSRTFEEIHPDGSKVIKVVGDDYEFTLGQKFIHISGNTNIVVGPTGEDGEGGNFTFYVKGDAELQVDGNVNQVIKKDVTQTVGGGITMGCKGEISITSEGNMNLKSKKDINIDGKNITLTGEKINLNA
tara:strand:- start:4181 stop:5179 length:999 start_codon:yes stop_codon:yes gene_type:complete